MLKSGVLKTIKKTCKNKIKKIFKKLFKNFRTNWVTLHIETWYQFVIKKHLIDEAVKLAVAFCEDGKIHSEIFWCRKVFVMEMLANRRRHVSMFVHALMQVLLCKAKLIICNRF